MLGPHYMGQKPDEARARFAPKPAGFFEKFWARSSDEIMKWPNNGMNQHLKAMKVALLLQKWYEQNAIQGYGTIRMFPISP